MKFKYSFLLFLFAGFMITACNSGNNNQTEKSSDNPTNAGNIKGKHKLELSQTFYNGRYNFSFRLPEGWKAEDQSTNGDGFFIKTNWPNIDMRAYAEQLLSEAEENEACDSQSAFTFDDKTKGTFCRNTNEWFFFRIKDDVRLVFYANASEKLLLNHEDEIKQIAATLKFD